MTKTFDSFFRSGVPARDKYLSRLFALFSEQIVRTWCACPEATYEDLGRPTLCEPGLRRGHTLDFTLRRRDSGLSYVAELKCELEYDDYRYLRLIEPNQLRHHTSAAFGKFLQVARNPTSSDIRRGGSPTEVDGAILIWGATTSEGCDAVIAEYGFADVLSVEAMVADLRSWAPPGWVALIKQYRGWTNELHDFLDGRGRQD